MNYRDGFVNGVSEESGALTREMLENMYERMSHQSRMRAEPVTLDTYNPNSHDVHFKTKFGRVSLNSLIERIIKLEEERDYYADQYDKVLYLISKDEEAA